MTTQSPPDRWTHYDAIEGYCNSLSYSAGQCVELCICTTARTYDVEVCRWGATRTVVWTQQNLTGVYQPTPPAADSHGCQWKTTLTIDLPDHWASGFYLITLRAHGVDAARTFGYSCFVLRPKEHRQKLLLILATNTWNAYNDWGGRSLYTGAIEVSFRRPWARGNLMRTDVDREDRKAPPRRFREEPDVDSLAYLRFREEHHYPRNVGSSGWFTHERRFVEWAERAGFIFDMATSSDLETIDNLTDGYQAVLSVGHDEYWSAAGRKAIESYVEGGGNYISISGNTMFWQVRPTQDNTAFECHKYTAHRTDPRVSSDPTSMTGMWCDHVVGQSERRFLGAASMYGLYARFGLAAPRGVPGFVIYRPDHWLLAGSGLRYGDMLGADDAVVGYECMGTRVALDELNLPYAVIDPMLRGDLLPDDVEIIALTPATNLGFGEDPHPIESMGTQGDLEYIAERAYGPFDATVSDSTEVVDTPFGADQRHRATAKVRHGNAVILTCRPYGSTGGTVLTIGTTDWVHAFGDQQIAIVTANALRRWI